jgi:hypothetical protein
LEGAQPVAYRRAGWGRSITVEVTCRGLASDVLRAVLRSKLGSRSVRLGGITRHPGVALHAAGGAPRNEGRRQLSEWFPLFEARSRCEVLPRISGNVGDRRCEVHPSSNEKSNLNAHAEIRVRSIKRNACPSWSCSVRTCCVAWCPNPWNIIMGNGITRQGKFCCSLRWGVPSDMWTIDSMSGASRRPYQVFLSAGPLDHSGV